MNKGKVTCLSARPAMCGIAVALTVAVASPVPLYAESYVYPNKGQSADMTEKDKYDCYQWAKGQTGVDPMQGQAPSKRTGLRGAAGGAAAGAAIGAIAGDAGKGAAIGAASGGIIGGAKKRRGEKAQASQKGEYDRAWGACMEGKGYTVK